MTTVSYDEEFVFQCKTITPFLIKRPGLEVRI